MPFVFFCIYSNFLKKVTSKTVKGAAKRLGSGRVSLPFKLK